MPQGLPVSVELEETGFWFRRAPEAENGSSKVAENRSSKVADPGRTWHPSQQGNRQAFRQGRPVTVGTLPTSHIPGWSR